MISSVIIEDVVQIDGRRNITEKHTDNMSVVHLVRYLAESGADVTTIMNNRVPIIEAQLIQKELDKNISNILEGNYNITTNYISLADMRTTLRNFYQTATGEQVGRMAGFLLTLTDTQLRTLFNMTQTQVNQLKTRLTSRINELNAVLNATGE